MLLFDPHKRLTVSECLDHKFFKPVENYIQETRNKYPIKHIDVDTNIIDCLERRIACNITFGIYNDRNNLDWYNHYILFHAIQLFDKYLYSKYIEIDKDIKTKESNIEDKKSNIEGKLWSQRHTILVFYTCVYIFYKYFSTLSCIVRWKDVFQNI